MKLKEIYSEMKLNWKLTFVTLLTVVLTLAVLAGVLFYEQEQNVITENKNYMSHKQERYEDVIDNCINSINMTTQFFLADESMLEVLKLAKEGKSLETERLVEFQDKDIKNLERLVSNNPLLYSARYYAANDNIQELMPIIYNESRMHNLVWAKEKPVSGWHFGYYDTAFSSLISNQKSELAGLVTEVNDYKDGNIGIIETSVKMSELFPGLYEEAENESGFFISDSGEIFSGNTKWDNLGSIIENLEQTNVLNDNERICYVKIGRQKLVVYKTYYKKLGGTLVGLLDISSQIKSVYIARNVFIAIMILVLLGLAVTVNIIVRRMLNGFYVILDNLHEVREGNLSIRMDASKKNEMGILGDSLNRMLDRIEELMQENINREVLVKNSEIRALQNQINAHFIYNVLESIKMMAEIDEKYEISDAITSLGKLLRYSMRWVSGNVKVHEELSYIKDYMALINLRYDYPIHLGINVSPEIMELDIPKMSLQPVIENAILHGIEPMGEESTIYIKGWIENGDCIIEVSDSGRGMTEEEVEKLKAKIEGQIEVSGGKGNGIGLKNVHDRVVIAFGSGYGLSIFSKLDCYTKVAIRIPYFFVPKDVKNENSINS